MRWRRACAIYCVAHFGKSLLWTASDLLTLYLLVSIYALAPTMAGAVFMVGLTASALADLGIGLWLARRPDHAAMLAGGALVIAALAFPATVLLAPLGFGALLVATVVFRIAYAGCDVPHNALLSRLGDTAGRAFALSRGRTIGTALASLVAAIVAGRQLATTPLLWSIAGGGWLIGSLMVPLLVAFPLSAPTRQSGERWRDRLPPRFLAASMIGIVALAALAKAVLHLPLGRADGQDGTAVLTWLVLGRTASALLPMRIGSLHQGVAVLALAYAASGAVAISYGWSVGPAMLVLLGLAMGVTNLIGWAILPLLAAGPRGYGVYAMASKVALGLAGLALGGSLGRMPTFTAQGYFAFTLAVAIACAFAAGLLIPRLTGTPRHSLSRQ
ncbi:hypothetical protein [Sphingomonas yabuuchiae]|uniref:hypothetical protein n=2 Tax=Sphingomonas TaxID=13687 RepID=UPI003D993AF6